MPHAIVGTYLRCKIIPWFSEMELLLGVLVWGYFVKFGVCFLVGFFFFIFCVSLIIFSAKSCNLRQVDKEGSWKIHLRRLRGGREGVDRTLKEAESHWSL